MAEEKKWGQTVLGWFIVQEDQVAEPSYDAAGIDETIRNAAAEEPDQGYQTREAPMSFQKEIPPAEGGKVDFEAVYDAAGIAQEDRDRVTKSVELLRGLPADTDPAVRKQIVEASLKAFGVPIEKIIESGVQEIEALESYIRAGAHDTEKLIEESDRRIRQYEEEMANIRSIMQQRVEEQQAVIRVCNQKKLEVQEILEFFGQERVARVVKESPKLHEPASQI